MILQIISYLLLMSQNCLCSNYVLSQATKKIFTHDDALHFTENNLFSTRAVPTPTPIVAPTTISSSGQYAVTASFSVTDTGITIAANDVVLDLGNFILDGQNSGQTGIAVNSGVSNVSIANGIIRNMTQYGIYSQGSQVSIDNIALTNNLNGIQLSSASNTSISNCTGYNNQSTAIALSASSNNFINNCTATNTSSSGASHAFFSTNGSKNVFNGCTATDTNTSGTTFGIFPAGFVFTGTESQSSIINCTSNHTYVSNSASLAQPFGIALNASMSGVSNLNSNTFGNGSVLATEWGFPADGTPLLAIGGTPDGKINTKVFLFDTSSNNLNQVGAASDIGTCHALSWSSSSAFLAVGGEPGRDYLLTALIYSFDETKGLSLITSTSDMATVNTLDFSPNDNYLAVGNANGDINISQFDRYRLWFLNGINHGAVVRSVQWSHSGSYLAVGGDESDADIRVFSWNGSTLTPVTTATHGAPVRSVAWSINDKYLVIGGDTSSGINARVYKFDGSSLTQVATAAHGARVNSVLISPRTVTVALAGQTSGGVQVRVYTFTGNALVPLTTYAHGATVYSLFVDPVHRLVSLGGDLANIDPINNSTLINNMRILNVNVNTVSNCIIENNNIFFTQGGMFPGVGLAAPVFSNSNLVNNNTLFGNDLNEQL